MLKILICFLMLLLAISLSAQTPDNRSLIRMARADVRNFRLNKTDLKEFRKNKKNNGSDYFKPAKLMVSDASLLTDSTYVKAFRRYAYVKTKSKVNTSIYALVGGGALLSYSLFVLLTLQFNGFD